MNFIFCAQYLGLKQIFLFPLFLIIIGPSKAISLEMGQKQIFVALHFNPLLSKCNASVLWLYILDLQNYEAVIVFKPFTCRLLLSLELSFGL